MDNNLPVGVKMVKESIGGIKLGGFNSGIKSYEWFKGEKFMVFNYFINSFSSQKFSKIK